MNLLDFINDTQKIANENNDGCPSCGGSKKKRDRYIDKMPTKDPRCICSGPIWISIPNGEHIHCPVHPDHIIYGPDVIC